MGRSGFKSEIETKIINERTGTARLFSYVGSCFSLLFAITSFKSGNIVHGTVLALLAVMVVVNLHFLKTCRTPDIPIGTLALAMGILFLYLLYTGGIHGSGILWFYIYPPLVYFLLGSRYGSIAVLLMVVCSALVLLLLGVPNYIDSFEPEFVQRLLASLTAISLLSYIYERSREQRYLEIIRLSKELEVQAGTDQLSGLFNRFSMTEFIEHEMLRQERLNRPFSLILSDIDLFKQINDSEGHLVGDDVIKEVALRIRGIIRKQDAAARWGGEEFLIFLPETDIEGALKVAHRMQDALRSLTTAGGNSITLSSGVAQSIPEDRDIDDIIHRCDKNLYLAKERGRDCVVC